MEKTTEPPVKTLQPANTNKILLGILVLSVIAGAFTGYYFATNTTKSSTLAAIPGTSKTDVAKIQQEKAYRDFAEGTLEKIPDSKNPKEVVEGTHLLKREDNPTHPVTLISSSVDLTLYEGKKIRVYGETQDAIKADWLLDVGKVDVLN